MVKIGDRIGDLLNVHFSAIAQRQQTVPHQHQLSHQVHDLIQALGIHPNGAFLFGLVSGTALAGLTLAAVGRFCRRLLLSRLVFRFGHRVRFFLLLLRRRRLDRLR